MRKLFLGLVLGFTLSWGVRVLADFGWSDSSKLERIAKATEGIVKQLEALRAEVKKAGEK
jgi:hypothetical protein